jgi:hypothetical protein
MFIPSLAGATLFIAVAAGPFVGPDDHGLQRLSMQQKNAAMQPLVTAATECIARKVAAHPRFRRHDPTADLGDLIVDSVPGCLGPVRAMIDAYDRYFGDGAGEAFFVGPYLDILPAAVTDIAVRRAD